MVLNKECLHLKMFIINDTIKWKYIYLTVVNYRHEMCLFFNYPILIKEHFWKVIKSKSISMNISWNVM